MHPKNQTNFRSKPCACNDCVYQTRSGSLEAILSSGSRIDRLYYNKFLPLRERKLLDKLVRTRAVYDDVRNRILSGSSSDISNEDDIKQKRKVERHDDANKNTIHELVHLVDRGELSSIHSPVNLHNECCTCCDCRSEIKFTNQPKVHMHIPSVEDVQQYLEHHKEKVRKQRKKAGRYHPIKSDSCMCILKSTTKRYKQYRERKVTEPIEVSEKSSGMVQKQRSRVHRRSVKSIAKKIHARKKMRDSIRSSITKIENVFRIKKDSLALFRDKMRKKHAFKYWTCEPGYCIPDECPSYECYNKIKRKHLIAKRTHMNKRYRTKKLEAHSYPPINKRHRHQHQYKSLGNISLPIISSKDGRILLKNTQASHKLDRCFCTLHLEKSPKVKLNSSNSPGYAHSKVSFTMKTKPQSFSKASLTKNSVKSPNVKCLCKIKAKRKSRSKPKLTKKPVKPPNVKCLCEIKQSISTSTQSSKTEKEPKESSPRWSGFREQRDNMNLSFYECEPSFCVPDACDPLLCDKRIQLRNLTDRHSLIQYTDTIPVNKKTKIISASATKTPPRSIQTRVPKHRTRALKPKYKEVPYTPKSRSSPNAPTKQVVRIGSSFKFDVEFFKDRNHPDTKKLTSTNESYVETSKIKMNSLASLTEVKPEKSIGLSQKMSHKKIKTKYSDYMNEPLLKRCLCTLKLLTAKQKLKPQKPYISKKTTKLDTFRDNKDKLDITFKSRSSMTTAVVNYVIPPQNFLKNLLPYECEPNFCTPGQCDPYVCAERIRMRNQSFKSRETNTAYTPTNSTASLTSSVISKSAGTYPVRQKQQRKRHRGNYSSISKTEHSKRPYTEASKSSINARQAVKLGSSFRFDIEFSKTKTNIDDKGETNEKQETVSSDRRNRYRRERTPRRYRTIGRGQGMDRRREKSIGEGNKLYTNEKMSQSSRSVASRPTETDNFLKRCFCTLKLNARPEQRAKRVMTSDLHKYNKIPGIYTQTRGWSDESDAYGNTQMTSNLLPYECEPNFCVPGQCDPYVCEKRIRQRNLLKRCFCTLKFRTAGTSRGNETERFVAPMYSRSIGTETPKFREQRYRQELLPYECEPGVCVPDHCDPYECQKRIDRRNMRDMHTYTDEPRRNSTFSGTSTYSKSQDSQSSFKQPRRRRGRGTHHKKSTVSGASTPSNASFAPSASNKSRQAVRISSQLSFNIEFYKNKRNPGVEVRKDKYEDSQSNKQRAKRSKGAYTQGFRISRDRGIRTGEGYHNRNLQAGSDISEKSTYAESRPERCFCTLKLHKSGRHQKRYEQAYGTPRGRS